MDALEAIRKEVDARFTSDAFYVRLADAMYEKSLRFEMKHLWEGLYGSFKGAYDYRMYVLEKIKLAQRKRYWEDMADFYAHTSPGSDSYNEAWRILADIHQAEKKLAQKRLDIRERIGEISYA